METIDLTWCEKHTEYMGERGVSTDDLVEALLLAIAKQGIAARGYSTPEDKILAAQALVRVTEGSPVCCHIGDNALRRAVDRAEKKQASL